MKILRLPQNPFLLWENGREPQDQGWKKSLISKNQCHKYAFSISGDSQKLKAFPHPVVPIIVLTMKEIPRKSQDLVVWKSEHVYF